MGLLLKDGDCDPAAELFDRPATGVRTTGDEGSENDGDRDDDPPPNDPDDELIGDRCTLVGRLENDGELDKPEN